MSPEAEFLTSLGFWGLIAGLFVFLGVIAYGIRVYQKRLLIQISEEDQKLIDWLREADPDIWGMMSDREIVRMARSFYLYAKLEGKKSL